VTRDQNCHSNNTVNHETGTRPPYFRAGHKRQPTKQAQSTRDAPPPPPPQQPPPDVTDTVSIRIYELQVYVTCYISGRIAIDNFLGNHRLISTSSSGMQPTQEELAKRFGFVAHCTQRCEHTVIRPSIDDSDNRSGLHCRRCHRHRLHHLLPHSGCPATWRQTGLDEADEGHATEGEESDASYGRESDESDGGRSSVSDVGEFKWAGGGYSADLEGERHDGTDGKCRNGSDTRASEDPSESNGKRSS